MMRVYQRDETGVELHTEDALFYPFFFLTDMRLLHGFPREKFRCKTLQGSNAYRHLVVFTTWQTHWDAVSHIARHAGISCAELFELTAGNPFLVTEVVECGAHEVPPSAREAVLASPPLAQFAKQGPEKVQWLRRILTTHRPEGLPRRRGRRRG